jgi:DNA polymerase-1
MDETKNLARQQGYVSTLFGRRIHVPGIRDKNFNVRGFAERQAINAPIQGAAADVIRRAMIRLPAAIEAAGIEAQMLLQVHDELVFEVAESQVEDLKALAKDVMQDACAPTMCLAVPLVVEAGQGPNWAEAH